MNADVAGDYSDLYFSSSFLGRVKTTIVSQSGNFSDYEAFLKILVLLYDQRKSPIELYQECYDFLRVYDQELASDLAAFLSLEQSYEADCLSVYLDFQKCRHFIALLCKEGNALALRRRQVDSLSDGEQQSFDNGLIIPRLPTSQADINRSGKCIRKVLESLISCPNNSDLSLRQELYHGLCGEPYCDRWLNIIDDWESSVGGKIKKISPGASESFRYFVPRGAPKRFSDEYYDEIVLSPTELRDSLNGNVPDNSNEYEFIDIKAEVSGLSTVKPKTTPDCHV